MQARQREALVSRGSANLRQTNTPQRPRRGSQPVLQNTNSAVAKARAQRLSAIPPQRASTSRVPPPSTRTNNRPPVPPSRQSTGTMQARGAAAASGASTTRSITGNVTNRRIVSARSPHNASANGLVDGNSTRRTSGQTLTATHVSGHNLASARSGSSPAPSRPVGRLSVGSNASRASFSPQAPVIVPRRNPPAMQREHTTPEPRHRSSDPVIVSGPKLRAYKSHDHGGTAQLNSSAHAGFVSAAAQDDDLELFGTANPPLRSNMLLSPRGEERARFQQPMHTDRGPYSTRSTHTTSELYTARQSEFASRLRNKISQFNQLTACARPLVDNPPDEGNTSTINDTSFVSTAATESAPPTALFSPRATPSPPSSPPQPTRTSTDSSPEVEPAKFEAPPSPLPQPAATATPKPNRPFIPKLPTAGASQSTDDIRKRKKDFEASLSLWAGAVSADLNKLRADFGHDT